MRRIGPEPGWAARLLPSLAIFFVLSIPSLGPAATASNCIGSSPAQTMSVVPVADSVSWGGFVKYWKGFVNSTDRVILIVAVIAASALFIITRGRWLK